jgi:hypothetical protein
VSAKLYRLTQQQADSLLLCTKYAYGGAWTKAQLATLERAAESLRSPLPDKVSEWKEKAWKYDELRK